MLTRDNKVYIAGHNGLVGSAIKRRLEKEFTNLVYKSSCELDLTDANQVERFFKKESPSYLFLAAAKVGGIHANNTHPADFITINLKIQTNVIEAAYRHGVEKLLFLGSSCIYPRLAKQPMTEDCFLCGKLEPTNVAYATSKIAGVIMCQSYNKQHGTNYISVMPTNLYGPNDNFDLETSHVLPALIRRFHEAKVASKKEINLWGTGSAYREFLHVDDLADACLFLMDNYDQGEIVNIGTGKDLTIASLAELVKKVVGFEGDIVFSGDKPDGMPKKQLDVEKLNALGWSHSISLEDGMRTTYEWYISNVATSTT
jgi:GDP-L-fucose synthase